MHKDFRENKSGCYDPTAKEVIDNESKRNKEIHDTIQEIKNIIRDTDLILIERIQIKDLPILGDSPEITIILPCLEASSLSSPPRILATLLTGGIANSNEVLKLLIPS